MKGVIKRFSIAANVYETSKRFGGSVDYGSMSALSWSSLELEVGGEITASK